MTEQQEDDNINAAVGKLLALLNKRIKLNIHARFLESDNMREIVQNVLKELTVSVTLESRKHASWVEVEFEDEDNTQVSVAHLGMGHKGSTWYGSPDARLRGFVPENEVIVISHHSEEPETDGASLNLELKRTIKKISQTIATTVLASFTEKNLHPTLNPLVPCILIDCRYIQIVMYDCDADVLLISEKNELMDENDEDELVSKSAILLLWLFINHRYISIIVNS